jgi:hypothetical protein
VRGGRWPPSGGSSATSRPTLQATTNGRAHRSSPSPPTQALRCRRGPRAWWSSAPPPGSTTTTCPCAPPTWRQQSGWRGPSASAAAGSGPCRRWGSRTARAPPRSHATCSTRRGWEQSRCRRGYGSWPPRRASPSGKATSPTSHRRRSYACTCNQLTLLAVTLLHSAQVGHVVQ